MKRLLLGCLLSSAITFPAIAALPTGHPAPDFKTQASLAGKAFSYSLKDALQKGPVVVYFYPSIFKHTPLLSTLTNSLPLVPQLLACLSTV